MADTSIGLVPICILVIILLIEIKIGCNVESRFSGRMKSPSLIGLLSILPGLGYMALGQKKHALLSVGFIVVLLLIPMFAQQFFIDEALILSVIAWIAQAFLSVQAGKQEIPKKLQAQTSKPRKPSLVILTGLSFLLWFFGIIMIFGLISFYVYAGWRVGYVVTGGQ